MHIWYINALKIHCMYGVIRWSSKWRKKKWFPFFLHDLIILFNAICNTIQFVISMIFVSNICFNGRTIVMTFSQHTKKMAVHFFLKWIQFECYTLTWTLLSMSVMEFFTSDMFTRIDWYGLSRVRKLSFAWLFR